MLERDVFDTLDVRSEERKRWLRTDPESELVRVENNNALATKSDFIIPSRDQSRKQGIEALVLVSVEPGCLFLVLNIGCNKARCAF